MVYICTTPMYTNYTSVHQTTPMYTNVHFFLVEKIQLQNVEDT